MLFNIFLPGHKTVKDKNGKNTAIDFCHFSENDFFNKNLSGANNASNKIFSNDKKKKKLMLASKKIK